MKFKTYYTALPPDGKRKLAERLGTSVPYLSQIAHGKRKAGPSLLLGIAAATGGKVTPHELRRDLASNSSRGGAKRKQTLSAREHEETA